MAFVGGVGLAYRPARPPAGRRHPSPVLAVRREHAVNAGQVDPGFGHQRRQTGDEIQRLEDDVGGAVPVGCLERPGAALVVLCRRR